MKTNWQTKKIGDVAKICLGLTHTPKYVEKGVPFLSVKDISQGQISFNNTRFITREEFNSMPDGAKPKKGDVLFCRVGTIGYPQIINEDKEFGIFVSLGFFRAKKGILSNRYIAYWMRSPLFDDQVRKNVQGSTLKNLNTGWLKNFDILLPLLPKQQHIVRILDKVFEQATKAKENAEKNLQNAHKLFESYLQSVFSNPGDGWEEKTLGEVLQKTETVDPTKSPNKEFIYIDVSSVNKETLAIENTALIKGKDAPSRARKLIKTNDVIFATVRPTLRRVAIIPNEFNEQVCSTGYFVLRTKEHLNNKLVFYFLRTNGFNEQMEKLQKGASYPAVTDGEVRRQIIPYPKSLIEQQTIIAKFDALSAEVKKLGAIYQQKLADLEELKKSILQKAFNGELVGAYS